MTELLFKFFVASIFMVITAHCLFQVLNSKKQFFLLPVQWSVKASEPIMQFPVLNLFLEKKIAKFQVTIQFQQQKHVNISGWKQISFLKVLNTFDGTVTV